MTIKEMEARSGMTRANIRFYEAEGLLAPARADNGYRDYSEQELDTLLRIKLLRTLHISLEEIKQVQRGERELSAVLDSQMERLDREQEELRRSQEICREMRKDNVRFDTLDAEKYLTPMEKGQEAPAPEIRRDVAPRVWIPWRRFFARSFDLALYSTLWECFLLLGLRLPSGSSLLTGNLSVNVSAIISLAMMIFLEPLFLRLFKTTPGKALFGIRVTDGEGNRLPYKSGLSRTCTVLWRGMGFQIPIYSLVRLYKSYKEYADEYPLAWEYDSELTVKDEKSWRCVAYVGGRILLLAVMALFIQLSTLPVHRAPLTVEKFCDNYNTYLRYYGYDTRYSLDSDGEWVEKPDEPGVFTFYVFGEQPVPELTFTEKDGVMTGLTMELSVEGGGDDLWLSSRSMERALFARSFLLAQKGAGVFDTEARRVVNWIENTPLESFTFSAYGVDVSCEIEYTGYLENADLSTEMLLPAEGEKRSFHMIFSMQAQE